MTELPEPLAVHESTPSPPCGRKRGRERWGGGRGANFEVVEVAVHDQHVIAVAALRKKTSVDGAPERLQTRELWNKFVFQALRFQEGPDNRPERGLHLISYCQLLPAARPSLDPTID